LLKIRKLWIRQCSVGLLSNKLNILEYNEYAKLHGVPLSTLFKKTLEEKMEDELDMQAIKEYEKNLENGDTETFTHEEVKKILDI